MTPQIILIVLWSLGLGIDLVNHGKPKKGEHNAWFTVIGILVIGSILYYGGFFNPLIK